MKITDLSVPSEIIDLLQKDGYSKLYPPQIDAVKVGVLEGKNLVLASPTASGKTLIAELCAMKHIFTKGGKVLYLTPLRALASEKISDFQKYTHLRKPDGRKVQVALTTGDYDSSDQWLERFDIILTTNEKADSLLRHKAGWINSVTLVVADEIHLITDPGRGPTLETVLAKLLTINSSLHLLALSATVENADELAEWLEGEAVTTNWRPVPLREGVYFNGEITFNEGSSQSVETFSGNQPIDMALEWVKKGWQALIFVETRRSAVEMGRKAAAALRNRFSGRLKPRDSQAEQILTTGEKTRLSKALADQVRFGSAFHHAGLGWRHRRLVEDMFRKGTIKVLAATPTLAAGVNLPARLVVVSSYERYESGYGRNPISVLEYKQFCGRAGRPRYDDFGEAILIARSEDEREFLLEKYVTGRPEKLYSKLASETSLRPHVLSTIATGFASSEEGLLEFFSKTFYSHQYGLEILKLKLGDILVFLYSNEMIDVEGRHIEATPYGRRVSELYIDPASAVILREGLLKGVSQLTDISFLHLISATPDLSPKLHPRKREMGELELFVDLHKMEFIRSIPNEYLDYIDYQEFLAEVKATKIFQDWINEVSEEDILERYKVEPGDLLRLVDSAEWLLYATEELSKLLKVKQYLNLLGRLRFRVSKGVKEELLSLVKLEGIGRVRARLLFNAGYHSIADLRRVPVSKLLEMPTIGHTLAKKIKEQVGGTIPSKDWDLLKKQKKSKEDQQLISEYPKK